MKKIVVSGNFQPTICEPEIARNHFLAFLLFFGQNLKKTPVPDNFSKISKNNKKIVVSGNFQLTICKPEIARNHFLAFLLCFGQNLKKTPVPDIFKNISAF